MNSLELVKSIEAMDDYNDYLEEIVGYGINQIGACDRSGSLRSYDHSFNTAEEAEEFILLLETCGYGDTVYGAIPVRIVDEILAIDDEDILKDMILNRFRIERETSTTDKIRAILNIPQNK